VSSRERHLVLTITCTDRTGLIYEIAGEFSTRGWNIDDSQQFADPLTHTFFMRVEASRVAADGEVEALEQALRARAAAGSMIVGLYDAEARQRLLILVSRIGHCLNDLLFRQATGQLHADVAAVVSNHPDLGPVARANGVAFHHLPVGPDNRAEQEAEILALVDKLQVDLVVLARYMQILSPSLVEALAGRAINIHHSFLPSFKGANPYRQAFERGVKVIGATAHFVTSDLDEGPIIEQEVTRVDHRMSPARLAALGQANESAALARAVTWQLEHRVFLNGNRAVVFR